MSGTQGHNDAVHSVTLPNSIRAAVGYGAIAQAAMRGLGFLRAVFLAWLLPEAQFGLMGTATLLVNALLPLATLGLHEGAARYAEPARRRGQLSTMIRWTTLAVLSGMLAVAILAFGFSSQLADLAFLSRWTPESAVVVFQDERTGLLRASAAALGSLALFQLAMGYFRGLRRFLLFNLMDVVAATAFTIFSFLAAWQAPWAAATLWAYAAGNVLSLLVVLWAIKRQSARGSNHYEHLCNQLDSNSEGLSISKVVDFSFHSAAAAMAWQFLLFYPAWYVVKSTDEANAGRFYTLRLMGQLLQYLSIPLSQILYGHAVSLWHASRSASTSSGGNSALASHDSDEVGGRLALQTRRALLALFAAVVFGLWARPLLEFIFPQSLRGTAGAFHAFAALYAAQGVVALISLRVQLAERAWDLSLAWIIGAAAVVTASWLVLGSSGGSKADNVDRFLELAATVGAVGPAVALTWIMFRVQRGPLPLTWREVLLSLLFVPPFFGPAAATISLLAIGVMAWRMGWLRARPCA